MDRIIRLIDSFNVYERIAFTIAACAITLGTIGIISMLISITTVKVPEYGGEYTEGVLGYISTPNPVIATTTVDQSISKLLYAGLLRKSSWNTYEPDLGTCEYSTTSITCSIIPGTTFHDGEPVTADDVIFTIETIQKAGNISPWYNHFVGITVQKKSDSSVQINLPKQFSGFDEPLTVGILPKHIWEDVAIADFGSTSFSGKYLIGAGPYRFSSNDTSKKTIVSTKFTAFQTTSNNPFISKIILKYYGTHEELIKAFNKSAIDGFVLESENADLVTTIKTTYEHQLIVHPELYGIFTKATLPKEKAALEKLAASHTVNLYAYGYPCKKNTKW
jgi:ABC-type transport system substrate-binding protein